MRAGPDQPDRPAPQILAERQPQLVALPHLAQPGRGTVGSAATNAPLSAPIEVPTTRSGLMSASASARSMPDLMGAEQPPAAEHERNRHVSSG